MEFSAKREHFFKPLMRPFWSPVQRHCAYVYAQAKNSEATQQTFLVFQDVLKTSWRRLQRNTFRLPRRLQDVFKTSSRRICKTSCNYVFKTSWKTKKCYTEDVFTKTNVCWEGFSLKFQKISKAFGKFCKKNFVHYVLSAQTRYTSDLHLLK